MTRSRSLDYATHNKEVCYHLSKEPDYSDWVITTAFYSALHFTDHKIFPLKIGPVGKEKTYPSFDSYYMSTKRRTISKHKLKLDLVVAELPEIAPHYNRLMDLCLKARYVDYHFSDIIAKSAKAWLDAVAKYCIV